MYRERERMWERLREIARSNTDDEKRMREREREK